MGKDSELGKNIDGKFEEAVDTDISGGGSDEEMDEFFEENFKEESGEGGVAEFDEDLGYAQESAEVEEETAEEEVDESEEEEEVEEESAAEEEEEGEESEEEEEGEEAAEEGEEEEVEDEEDFYDGQRDYGDDAVPTRYENRMAANHGLVAKISYFRDLQKRLNDAGGDIGALALPDVADGDPESLNQYSDIEQVISLPDDEAKKMVAQMDSLLRNMKGKAKRYEEQKQKQEKKQEVTQELVQAQQDAKAALDFLKLDVKKNMTNEEIINMAYDRLEEFESNDENLDSMSQQEFVKTLRDMEDAVFALEDFARVAAEHETVKQQEEQENQKKKVTPEQIESAFKEFMNDQPNLDMVKNNRVEMQKSLIQTAIRKGWNLAEPRDWLQNYNKFMKIVNANRTERGLKKLKNEEADEGAGSKKKDGKKTGRAKKYANKKPKKSSGSLSYSNRTDKKEVDQIDDEIDRLAAQLTDESVDEW